uniref:Uncharacterized protein n=1 Tax=Arundo donax TaxID=35708 RepID=A0A0A9BBZ5_ARUDO
MKQRGQAASTMDVASGLLDHCRPCSFSDDRQELGDDSLSAIALLESPVDGSERFSFRSRPLELFLLLRLILGGMRSLHPSNVELTD